MKISIRNDSIVIEGYVNAVERNSKPLMSRIGRFIERICKGCFGRAIDRNDDVHVLLNHDWCRDLGTTKTGELELHEDAIGLYARACVSDQEVIDDAINNRLVGWSFGFYDRDVEEGTESGLPLRIVKDMDLVEVSILNKSKIPAYDGTLIMARSEDDMQLIGEALIEEVEVRDLREKEPEQDEHPEADTVIDYSEYESIISEMKGE